MKSAEQAERIARAFLVPVGNLQQTTNRAVRTLPGGDETLDAIEALNAACNHAQRAKAFDRVTATEAAIARVEEIRAAMVRHVRDVAGLASEAAP